MRDRLSAGVSIDFQVNHFPSWPYTSLIRAVIQDVISRFTLDSATDFLFGASVGSLLTDLPYPHHHPSKVAKSSPADDFAAAFAEAQLTIAARNRQGWVWPLIEIFKDIKRRSGLSILAQVEVSSVLSLSWSSLVIHLVGLL